MPRAIKNAAGSVENAANWASVLLQEIQAGRVIQAKADVIRLLAGDWGGIEFRLQPDDGPPADPDYQGGN